MKKLILLLMFVICINLVIAQEINVVKEAKDEIKFKEVLEVKISINNPTSVKEIFEIREKIPQGVALVEPKEPHKVEMHDALNVMFFEWTIEVLPNEVYELSYKITPEQLGSYTISPTVIRDELTEDTYLSNPLSFFVSCIPNRVCEEAESYFTCSEDCGSGAKDGVCVNKADGICDPDCSDDPDCKGASNFFSSLYFWIFVIIIILILFFVILKFKKKSKKKELSSS